MSELTYMDGDIERQMLAQANSELRSQLRAIQNILITVRHGQNWDPDGNCQALKNISEVIGTVY